MQAKKNLFRITMVLIASVIMSMCIACANKPYNLTRDKSLKTNWGTVFQFKVDENWNAEDESSDYSASASFTNDDNENLIIISCNNTAQGTGSTTYGEFLDSMEDTYTKTPQEWADMYIELDNLMGDDSNIDPKMLEADYWPTFSDYTMEELDSIEVEGNTFRVFHMKVNISYSDSMFEDMLEQDPDAKQNEELNTVYGVLYDGEHAVNIISTDEELLKDFMNTLTIKW